MVAIKEKQFLIDGEPKIILSGEIPYYRLDKRDWQDRITKLKEAGLNTVASYIPWICHEEAEGEFDLYGESREELDLAGFIDLCGRNELYFIARPGPFIMAEMKNEGIPYWVTKKYPNCVPTTWDNKTVSSSTLDYLHTDYLACVKKWYAAVIPLLAERLPDRGGNLIGVQLDNEIGMLSWCTNSPDLTETTLKGFWDYLEGKGLIKEYPFAEKSFEEFTHAVISPKEEYVLTLHKDLGHYMRSRFAEYVKVLSGYAGEYGISGVPFFVNIHGTGGGRGLTYPIGISQLYEAYTMSSDYLAGSDLYLGSLDMNNFQDLYIDNAYMEAVNLKDQPLASLEFECGDGDYGETLGGRADVSAADFKIRMCIAQGNKLLNCYLFCGGRNYVLNHRPGDGNDRVAFTGERHGFAAPVSPEGELNYTYDRMAKTMKMMGENSCKLAGMQEERDNIALGFIPDYYMTEYCYPKSGKETGLTQDLARFRGAGEFELFARAMLLKNYRFSALNIQDREFSPKDIGTIVIFSASFMAESIQKKLADFVSEGGSLLLHGRIPEKDMEGRPCTILKELAGVERISWRESGERYYLSTIPQGYLTGAEVRCSYAQAYETDNKGALLRIADTGEICAFEKTAGQGKLVMIGTDYISHLENVSRILSSLSGRPALSHEEKNHGLFMTMMKNSGNEKFLHILNLDGFTKKTRIFYKGETLFQGKELKILPKEGLMLPIDMEMEKGKILYSTGEIMAHTSESITFRLTQPQEEILWEGIGILRAGEGYIAEEKDGNTHVKSCLDGRISSEITLYYA